MSSKSLSHRVTEVCSYWTNSLAERLFLLYFYWLFICLTWLLGGAFPWDEYPRRILSLWKNLVTIPCGPIVSASIALRVWIIRRMCSQAARMVFCGGLFRLVLDSILIAKSVQCWCRDRPPNTSDYHHNFWQDVPLYTEREGLVVGSSTIINPSQPQLDRCLSSKNYKIKSVDHRPRILECLLVYVQSYKFHTFHIQTWYI